MVALPLFCSCSDEDNGKEKECMDIGPFCMDVRFEDAGGNNLLDKEMLNLSLEGQGREFDPEEDEVLKINCYRESDHKQQNIAYSGWTLLDKIHPGFFDIYDDDLGFVMRLRWTDYDLWNTDLKIQPREEVYVVELASPRIFKDEKPHTIKWFAHIYGWQQFEFYRCETDGKAVVPDGYPTSKGWDLTSAVHYKVE